MALNNLKFEFIKNLFIKKLNKITLNKQLKQLKNEEKFNFIKFQKIKKLKNAKKLYF